MKEEEFYRQFQLAQAKDSFLQLGCTEDVQKMHRRCTEYVQKMSRMNTMSLSARYSRTD
jgi:hypothetical protein